MEFSAFYKWQHDLKYQLYMISHVIFKRTTDVFVHFITRMQNIGE